MVFAQAPSMSPFTGDIAIKNKEGKDLNGKLYFSGSKMRMDMNSGGRDAVMIYDIASKTSYMIMPQQKMYMEMKAGQMARNLPKISDLKSYDPDHPCAQQENMTCEKIGSETIDGRSTDHWTFKDDKDGSVMHAWIDRKIHYPIRTTTPDSQMDISNIQEGEPSASLFEIPSDYRKFDMGAFAGGHPQSQ
jgi:hypothetical protein